MTGDPSIITILKHNQCDKCRITKEERLGNQAARIYSIYSLHKSYNNRLTYLFVAIYCCVLQQLSEKACKDYQTQSVCMDTWLLRPLPFSRSQQDRATVSVLDPVSMYPNSTDPPGWLRNLVTNQKAFTFELNWSPFFPSTWRNLLHSFQMPSMDTNQDISLLNQLELPRFQFHIPNIF